MLKLIIHVSSPGPSSAFKKWSGHAVSKGTRGVRGVSPEKNLYFRMSVQTILMHLGTIFALEALLILLVSL